MANGSDFIMCKTMCGVLWNTLYIKPPGENGFEYFHAVCFKAEPDQFPNLPSGVNRLEKNPIFTYYRQTDKKSNLNS